jgi:hypothetical protein
MGILKKILGIEETETKNKSKKALNEAKRDKMRTPTPEKTSVLDKVRSQKEQSANKTPKVKAERAAQKSQKSAQNVAQKAVKRR